MLDSLIYYSGTWRETRLTRDHILGMEDYAWLSGRFLAVGLLASWSHTGNVHQLHQLYRLILHLLSHNVYGAQGH